MNSHLYQTNFGKMYLLNKELIVLRTAIFLLFFSYVSLFGEEEEVRIEANIFEANEKDMVSIFSGDVKIKKGEDEINSSVVKIYFDEENQPEKYEMLDRVSFKLNLREGSTYLGKAERVYLYPNSQKYIFSENVKILEIETGRRIEGDKVSLDGETGSARILGGENRPVVMSFKIEKRDK
jgi:lipopolysaccharide export system protein LptA